MYELINTSVPNGLIAGTHGFATVAMTKGMPDAIRTRVESFCAYPHRTSAHDQSYFGDNPVNWFHLQIPSGDHVVGRTAPSEFDYTGRTNRLAHTLVFSAKEMPVVGGAYVLGAESRRFVAEWSGEPKYLAVDKTTAGRLGLADVPRNASPTNWISVFGENGAKYARRFAALVAKNVSGGNKSVYFKTSTAWDSDGTRLLGLFADLINLLPESVRPFVTFSTFAACVPNGVACHLRGVYDKDRAFEIASTTQSWVDCEHGRIVHEELLPEDDLIGRDSTDGVNGARVAEHQQHLEPIRDANQIVSPKQRMGGRSSNSSSASMIKMLLIGGISFVLVIVGVGYWWLSEQQKKQSAVDELLKAAKEDQVKEIAKEKDAQQERQREIDESVRRDLEQKDKAAAKAKDDQVQREEEERLKSERQARENADRLVAEAKAKEDAEKIAEIKRCRDEALNTFPSNITMKIQQAWKEDGSIDKCLKDSEKAELTNNNSIVAWWWSGSELKHANCHYVVSIKKEAMTGKKRTIYTLSNVAAEGSNWIVYRCFGRTENVIWLWTEKVKGKLFEGGADKIDLAEKCFGDCEDARKLYANKIKVIYGIEYRQDVKGKEKIRVPLDKSELSIDFFKPEKSDEERRKKQMEEELDRLICVQTNKCAELKRYEQDVVDVGRWYDAFESATTAPDKENAEQQQNRNQRRDSIRKDAYKTFKKYGLAVDASRSMAVITKGKDAKENLIKQMGSVKTRIEAEVRDAEDAVKKKKDANEREIEGFNKWKDRVRSYVFEIAVEVEELPTTLLNKKKRVQVDAGE